MSSKEAKNAAKAQKKAQKTSKKQQLQQQQQQQQQQASKKSSNNGVIKSAPKAMGKQQQQSTPAGSEPAGGRLVDVKVAPSAASLQNESFLYHMNNNNNNNNNTLNTLNNNMNELDVYGPGHLNRKIQELQERRMSAASALTIQPPPPPGYENAPKFERSNSFSLRRFSKFFNAITGSKENLSAAAAAGPAANPDEPDTGYKFQRSRSMIMLRRPNRRSLAEPQLEQLSEEADGGGTVSPTPASPRKNSLETDAAAAAGKPPGQAFVRPVSLQPTATFYDKEPAPPTSATYLNHQDSLLLRQKSDLNEDSLSSRRHRRPSSMSLASQGGGADGEGPYNPQLNFQKRRSSTLLASFKSTLNNWKSNASSAAEPKKKEAMNPKWSASLQSLQVIDNMVSYKNMSFIDYDKFNAYEKQLERKLSTMSLMDDGGRVGVAVGVAGPMMPPPGATTEIARVPPIFVPAAAIPPFSQPYANHVVAMGMGPGVVVRRRKPSSASAMTNATKTHFQSHVELSRTGSESSFNLDTNYEHNLDKLRNVYRDSLDSRKLERLNDITRNSFVLDQTHIEALNLEDGTVGKRRSKRSAAHNASQHGPAAVKRRSSSSNDGSTRGRAAADQVDGSGSSSSQQQIKSKSLTHLDGLGPTAHAACLPPGANPEGFPNRSRSRTRHVEQNLIGDYIGPNDADLKGPSASMAAAADYAYTGTLHPFSYANMSVFSRTLPPPGRVRMAAASPPIRARSASPLYTFRKSFVFMCSERGASEYFAVSFCNEHGYQEEEFIPARFGVRLGSSLQTNLKRRNLTFADVYVIYSGDIAAKYIETGQISSQDALREDTDVGGLGGLHLVILERNPNKQTIQKAAAFGVRPHPPVLATGASTDEPPVEPPPPPKPTTSSKSMPKNSEQTLLDRLNRVYRNGATTTLKPQRLPFQHPQLKEALAYLDCVHTAWKDFIPGVAEDDPEAQIQTAIWELVSTEASYIRAMQVVTDLFMCSLEAVQTEDLLREVNLCDLFSNARQIVEVNLRFWTFYIFPMVAESLADHRPMRCRHLIDGFTAFPSTFEAYKVFCAEQTKCQHYCKELNRFNAQFTTYLSWCESQKACNRLRLADLLVRPMQRLTKYSLLLAAIKKHMVAESDILQMENMIEIVDTFVFSVNVHLTTCQETERLKGVMARIESYDVVDAHTDILQRLVDVHSTMFDLTGPMIGCAHHHSRHLFMEGDHKFKDGQSKSDVHCFLFTDILLICKSVSKKHSETLKVIRQPFFTDRLSMHLNEGHNIISCVYLNEFNVATAGFTLQSSEAKSWYDAFRRAKNIYMRLKQSSNCWEGLRFVGLGGTSSMSQTDGLNMNKLMAAAQSASTTSGPAQQGYSNSCNGSFEWSDARQLSMETETTTWNEEDQSATKKTKKKPKQAKQPPKTRTGWPLNLLNLGQSLPNLTTHQSNPNFYHTYSNNTLHVPGTAAAAAAGTSQSGNLLLSPEHRGKSYPPPSPNRVPLRRGDAFSNSSKNPPLVKTRNITSQQASDCLLVASTPASSPNKLAGSQTSLLRSISVNEGGSASDREFPTSSNSSLQSTPQPHYAPPPLGHPQQLQPPPITMSSSSEGGGDYDAETTTTIQLYSPGPRLDEEEDDGADGAAKQGETFV